MRRVLNSSEFITVSNVKGGWRSCLFYVFKQDGQSYAKGMEVLGNHLLELDEMPKDQVFKWFQNHPDRLVAKAKE